MAKRTLFNKMQKNLTNNVTFLIIFHEQLQSLYTYSIQDIWLSLTVSKDIWLTLKLSMDIWLTPTLSRDIRLKLTLSRDILKAS